MSRFAVGCVATIALVAVAPGAQSLLTLSRVGVAPQVDVTWSDGVGIFDPASPANSCLALDSFRTTNGHLHSAQYYSNLRMATNKAETSNVFAGASVPAAGTALDDCFGLNAPGNSVGSSSFQVQTGYTFDLEGQFAGNLVVAGAISWAVTVCTISPGGLAPATVMGAANVFRASGVSVTCGGGAPPAPAPIPLGGLVTESGIGFVATGPQPPFLSSLGVMADSVVESCLDIAGFMDVVTGLPVAGAADETWFVVLTETTGDGVLWTTTVDVPTASLPRLDALVPDIGSC